MKLLTNALLVSLLFASPAAAGEGKVEHLKFGSGGETRSYYLFIPDKAAPGPAPLLMLLHGSGHDGKSLIDPWLGLAKAEGIVLLAPDASNPQAWRTPQEGPDFFHDLVELVRISHDVIDDRRMYVFGHSAGAMHGLYLAVLESEYFAAVAVHAGVLNPPAASMLGRAPRKIPIAMWVGTDDALFPLDAVRQSRDVLKANGFNAQLTEIGNHTHDYYARAGSINKEVWAFLRQHTLAADPKFQQYQLIK